MNWDRVEGNWKEIKGKAKQQWGKLTDDDLDVIEGRRDELEGRLQKHYGYAKDTVKTELILGLDASEQGAVVIVPAACFQSRGDLHVHRQRL